MNRPLILALALAFVLAGCQVAQAGWPDEIFARAHQPAPIRAHRAPAVKAWRAPRPAPARIPGPLNDAPTCQAAFRTVGDQAVTVGGAKEAAEKAFAQQARFSWGERFADVTNARSRSYECVRSSIGSVAGQVFHRCELRAQPCMAPQEGAEK